MRSGDKIPFKSVAANILEIVEPRGANFVWIGADRATRGAIEPSTFRCLDQRKKILRAGLHNGHQR